MLGISILYNGKIEGFECDFPCFLPEYDAIFHAMRLEGCKEFFELVYDFPRYSQRVLFSSFLQLQMQMQIFSECVGWGGAVI